MSNYGRAQVRSCMWDTHSRKETVLLGAFCLLHWLALCRWPSQVAAIIPLASKYLLTNSSPSFDPRAALRSVDMLVCMFHAPACVRSEVPTLYTLHD